MKFLFLFCVLAVCAFAAPSKIIKPSEELARITSLRLGDVVFTPTPLPCSYEIKMECVITDPETNQTSNTEQDFYVDGEVQIFAIDYSFPALKMFEQDISRMDQPYDQGGVTYIPRYGAQTGMGCVRNDEEQSEAKSEISSLLGMFLDKQVYQSVIRTVFKGKECNMYYTKTDDSEVRMYVDDDGYIIGTLSNNPDYNILMAISYDFSISMDAFTIDRSQFPECEEKAYVPPQDQCSSY